VVAIKRHQACAYTTDFSVSPTQDTARFFDGSAWTSTAALALVDADGVFSSISASSASNVWTWAFDTVLKRWEALRFNGKAWAVVKVPAALIPHHGGHPPAGDLLGPIASDGAGGLWLYAGKSSSKFPFIRPFFVHYHAGTWTTAASPTSSLGFLEVSAIAHIPGTRSLWAVGSISKGEGFVGGAIIKFGR
jgi:hypothetical protein